ncbi:MAG: DNA mismatch repair protein MutS [Flavobacteriaceae bacterium]
MTKVSKFKVGDRVSVIDDQVEGKVSRIDQSRIYIIDQSGFEYWFEAHELVLLGEDQKKLSLYADINNPLLAQKINSVEGKKKSVKRVSKEIPAMEVDLHIEKLVRHTHKLDPYDIMIIQMDTAQRKLEYAINNRIPRIVFIHGVGEGVLEQELRYLLGRYPVRFEPANYRKYGMGATDVYIVQNA